MTDRELAGCPLLPCPWCGSAPLVLDYIWAGRHGVACNNDACPATMEMTGPTREEAIAAWNRRAPAGEDARPTIADLIDAKLAEGDKRDAARYRWLRDLPDGSPYECIGNMPGDCWDDEIDAAIAATEGGDAPDLP